MNDRITRQSFLDSGGLAGLRTATGRSLADVGAAAMEKAREAQKTQPAPSKRKRGASSKVPTEHQEQTALFAWAAAHSDKRLEMLFAIPNGAGVNHQRGKNGQRFSLEGAKLKREGMKQGVPDAFLACPSGQWHGLFLEMKRAKKSLSRVTPEQLQWKAALEAMGYCVTVCYGADEAKAAIENYLGAK